MYFIIVNSTEKLIIFKFFVVFQLICFVTEDFIIISRIAFTCTFCITCTVYIEQG